MKHPRFIEVFITNIDTRESSGLVITCLSSIFEPAQVSVDLEDVDCVLRVASSQPIDSVDVKTVVETLGFQAEVMPDDFVTRPSLRDCTCSGTLKARGLLSS